MLNRPMQRDHEPPNRPLRIVANPCAGGRRARALAEQLAAALHRRGQPHELRFTRAAGDARILAARAAGPVVAVGGDGTVNEVLNGLTERAGTLGPLAILPAGSGDDFAAGAGLPNDPDRLADTFATGHIRRVDYGIATIATTTTTRERRFANAVDAGFVAEVAHLAHRLPLRGRLRYLAATLRALLRPRTLSARITVDEHHAHEARLMFASFCNSPRVGGGLPFTPAARIDDGALDLLEVETTSRRGILALLGKLVRARHLRDRRVRTTTVRRARLVGEQAFAVAMDGELVATDATSLQVEIRAGGLALITPMPAPRGPDA